jgi:hypothetical protein
MRQRTGWLNAAASLFSSGNVVAAVVFEVSVGINHVFMGKYPVSSESVVLTA